MEQPLCVSHLDRLDDADNHLFAHPARERCPVVLSAKRLHHVPWSSLHLDVHVLFTVAGGSPQDSARLRRIEEKTHKRLRVAEARDKHCPVVNSLLSSSFRAVQNEIGHSSTFQIRRPLD